MLNIHQGNLKLFAMLFCNLISNTLMVSKFRIPTISPLKFSALVWPLARGPRILLQWAPAGYLWCDQSWLQCCRCRKSLFLTFCKNCNNNEMTRVRKIISAVTIYRISTLLRLEIHRCLDHFCKVPFNNFINCIYMFWSNVGARFRKCINNAIFYPASINLLFRISLIN